MEQMLAEGEAAQAAKEATKAASKVEMKKSFGDGMKAGLRQGFLGNKKKKKGKLVRPTGRDESVQSAIRKEVAEKMLGPAREWLTPDLMQEIKKRPELRKVFEDERYASALELLHRNPKEALEKFEKVPELRNFLREFCSLMGGHFDQLGQAQEMGPLVKEAVEREQNRPPPTPDERAQVDRVVADAELSSLLMNPATQRLMQRCADPLEFQRALANPDDAKVIHRLRQAGLVQIQA